MNKKRILAIIMSLVMITAVLAGCGSKISVKDDLTNYDKKVSKIMDEMKSTDSSKDDKMVSAIKDFTKKVKDVNVKTDEVKDVNKLLIKAFEEMVNVYEYSIKAKKDNDKDLSEKATDEYTKASKDLDSFKTKIEALAKKEGIKLEMNLN